MINSENAMLRGGVLFNVRDQVGSTVKKRRKSSMHDKMPKAITWNGADNGKNQIRANKTLSMILPIVVIIFLILYFTYHSMKETVTMITITVCFDWRDFLWFIFMVLIYPLRLRLGL
jgi:Cu(I)/Ag(I) efflux system membrane protein CusA/SilA